METSGDALGAFQIPLIRTKRPHRKSRRGCYCCKQRRVKCDERRPICTTCRARATDCVYPSEHGKQSSAATRTESPVAGDITNEKGDSTSPPSGSSGSPTQPPSLSQLEVSEQELTECYFARVASTFMSSNPRQEQYWIWHVFIPSVAYTSQPVRYGMLTLGAMYLHFATSPGSGPSAQRYVDAANSYGSSFVEQSRQQLSRLEASEVDSNVACSRLLGVLSLAFHREYRRNGLHCGDSAAWKWIHLLRGVKTVHQSIMASGQSLDPVLQLDMAPDWSLGESIAQESLGVSYSTNEALLAYIQQTSAHRFQALRDMVSLGCANLDNHQQNHCNLAVETLADVTAQIGAMRVGAVFRVLGTWIGRVPLEFVSMLESCHHAALAIYAHWLMVLVLAENLWFIGDMGRAGIRDAMAAASSPEIQHVFQWPQDVLERY